MRSSIGPAALALLASFVVGCGGDDDEGSETTDPQTYTAAVCSTLDGWIEAIQTGAEGATQLPPGASPQEGKDFMTSFIGDSLAETTSARDALADAGAPDVEGGQEIADALVSAFDDAVAIFEQAGVDAEALPTDSPQAFDQAATEIGDTTQQSLEEAATVLTELGENQELNRAAEDTAECQDLAAASG
ncbi:MAG: hypothetical protein ACRDK9_09290 [Solirubrobacterales bacterium]